MPLLIFWRVRVKIKSIQRKHEGKLLHSHILSAESIKKALFQVVQLYGVVGGIKFDKWVLKLDAIPAEQFETLFIPRLVQAFAECFAREEASIRGRKEIGFQTSNATELHKGHSDEKKLFQWAQSCLQPTALKSLIQDSSAYQLQQLLKLVLEGVWQSPKILPVSWYGRVTADRLSMAAALYLLKSQKGHDWLMYQHSPTASQVTSWVKAIVEGEIPPEQVAQLLTGNRLSDSALPELCAYSPLIVMRWLLPLWRHPPVRQMVLRLKGWRDVQHLDAYLSRCLQLQDNNDVMREEQDGYTDLVLSRDNTIDGFRLPNELCSSSQCISNAGLLLLWPLLPQLFSQLGLWEEERFVSDAARWQAVYGLDRLVWGEVNPAEERLTLNQVLCGVSCSTAVPPPTLLSLLQLQQIDDWLAAIGQQLVGWQKLSLTDIRQLFLQRAGEISTEGAVPQINVCPEPYDFLLRDWPWPMTLASFPWTEQPLTIVWPLTDFTR